MHPYRCDLKEIYIQYFTAVHIDNFLDVVALVNCEYDKYVRWQVFCFDHLGQVCYLL